MMFSDVDLLFTNSLSDDLNENSVTSVIFIANVPEFTASDRFEQTRCLQILHACLHARKKTESFFASNSKCIVYFNKMFFFGKLFVDFCVFVNSYTVCV